MGSEPRFFWGVVTDRLWPSACFEPALKGFFVIVRHAGPHCFVSIDNGGRKVAQEVDMVHLFLNQKDNVDTASRLD